MKDIFNFLRKLAVNNNREWFKQNKSDYDSIRVVFEFMIQQLIDELQKYDSSIVGIKAKDCIFRIYRDIRFSYDKTPYKPYFSAWISHNGRKGEYPGYYIHIEPGNSFLAAGIWNPDPKLLKMVRKDIYENYDEFHKIISDKDFISTFTDVEGDSLIKLPKGFDSDFEGAKYIKLKEFVVSYKTDDNFFNSEDWINETVRIYSKALKLNKFLYAIVQEFYE